MAQLIESKTYFLKCLHSSLLLFFQQQFFRKFVDLSRIRTQIVGIVGKHADNLTTAS